jgi:hypothetical protein
MTAARQRLPDRRQCESFAFQCAGMAYVASISRFPNGDLAEIFISNHKAGSDADSAAKDSAFLDAIDLLHDAAVSSGLVDAIGDDAVQKIMAAAFSRGAT